MKYVVVGGAGFIGSTFIDEVLKKDKDIKIVCIDNFSTGYSSNISSSLNVKIINTDISTLTTYTPFYFNKVKDVISDADVMFHFAAKARVQPSINNPIGFNDTNVTGTLNLLEICRQENIKRFIFSSSSSIYGDTDVFPTPETASPNPLSPYGLQKLIGEQYCKLYSTLYNVETVCLRYFNVYGDKMPTSGAYCLVMGIFAQLKKLNKALPIYGDGSQRRDFTYVKDVIRANILASTSDKVGNGEIINIGNGDSRSVRDIANIFGSPFEYKPKRVEPIQTLADNNKAQELLNWKPTGDVERWLLQYIKKYVN